MDVSVLGFGGSEIGYEAAAPPTVRRLLNGALDAGLNVIDTAECYADSEALIGGALGARRRECFLFTKCGHPKGFGAGDWRPASLLDSIARSLQRLQTDAVDLVQLHSCSEAELRRGDVIAALETARERGMTRYIGYSGDGDAARFAVETGRFDTLQISISVADQEALDGVLPLAAARNVGVIAKRPIANAAWRTGRKPASGYHHEYWRRLRELDYEFLRRPLPEAVGVALRFTLAAPGVHTAIVGTTNPDRWRDNAALLGAGPLSAAETDAIRRRWRAVARPDWHGQT
ncbi:MAG TPA: aldo/keto reductase [Methylomirabilota bacterium]|jgi:aryl-alcohol dehydrogenase-like predicted oxidoreductase|nr:aldo/keto reductase [Methylomirabilota bacterium]